MPFTDQYEMVCKQRFNDIVDNQNKQAERQEKFEDKMWEKLDALDKFLRGNGEKGLKERQDETDHRVAIIEESMETHKAYYRMIVKAAIGLGVVSAGTLLFQSIIHFWG